MWVIGIFVILGNFGDFGVTLGFSGFIVVLDILVICVVLEGLVEFAIGWVILVTFCDVLLLR